MKLPKYCAPKIFSGLILCVATSANADTVWPSDTCSETSSFVEFRRQLQDAIERQDQALLLSLAGENIQNGFGGEGGRDELIEYWQFDEAGNSPNWAELANIMQLGCRMTPEGDFAVIPSVDEEIASQAGDREIFRVLLATGTRIALRQRPRLSSPVLERLSWQIVTRGNEENTPPDWHAVTTDAGNQGYVHRNYIRSTFDYRAGFSLTPDGWRMTYFLAGD